ncbi:50S ribosomal protein L4 [Candidatus Dependentiae bacterium]|nr:50S ribosomal protein L4 [Candidatus Dependentiae bacterium]
MSKVKMINSAGQEQEAVSLGLEVPSTELSPKTYACAVRVLLQNWRQGTVAVKSRGQVAFSNKKPWRQKGTGRARAGSARSPLWRKGGVVFGPQSRVRGLKLNGKQRRLCLQNLFRLASEKNMIYCVDNDFSLGQVPKTKKSFDLIKSMGLAEKKGILFLPYDDVFNCASFRNIPQVGLISFDQPNVFDLSSAQYWMFLKKDLQLFKDMVAKWI